ncbi:MAG: fluoride efflux transporter CrcB [Ruminococcus sp.]
MDLIKGCLFVGLGGFVGAVMRFLVSSIPIKSSFPFLTLVINIVAAVMIGFFTGLFSQTVGLNTNLRRFLTTGVCGVFSTFSTFSSELVTLYKSGHMIMAVAYGVLSVALCVAGVLLGEFLATLILKKA